MKGKIVIIFVGITLLLPFLPGALSDIEQTGGNTIYVDDDNTMGPWDGSQEHPFQHIQDGVDNASDGDTIYVYAGVYYENIFIDITINLIGEDRDITIIDGDGKNDVVYIGSSGKDVALSGFTIQNSGNDSHGQKFDVGIEIHSHHNVISNNIILNHNNDGIYLCNSDSCNITNNIISNNSRAGIELANSKKTIMSNNDISYNGDWGIVIHIDGKSNGNIISNNILFSNDKGIALFQSGNNIYCNNFISNLDNAVSHFNPIKLSPSRNSWDANYWDDWRGFGPKWILGFLGFNFDWHPVKEPYELGG